MVVFFVTRDRDQTLRDFFETWGSRLEPRVRIVHYEELAATRVLPGAATYVFTDLERLSPTGLELASRLADTLAESGSAPRIVNHPRQTLRRYELLRVLHEQGINQFQAHRVPPVPPQVRYPVFLRSECDHTVLSRLLSTEREVERELVRLRIRGYDLSSLLAIEFEDVSDEEGMYHRFVAHVIGEAIVPGYLAFGTNWIVKAGLFLEGKRLAAQLESVASREHEPFFREVAGLAGVGYGRFDYAVVDGRIHVWELNTNPTVLLREEDHRPAVREMIRPLAERLTDAFELLAGEIGEDLPPVPVALKPVAPLTALAQPPRSPLLRLVLRGPVRAAARRTEPLIIRLARPRSPRV